MSVVEGFQCLKIGKIKIRLDLNSHVVGGEKVCYRTWSRGAWKNFPVLYSIIFGKNKGRSEWSYTIEF